MDRPRENRTPEVITIDDSDSETSQPQPSRPQNRPRTYPSSRTRHAPRVKAVRRARERCSTLSRTVPSRKIAFRTDKRSCRHSGHHLVFASRHKPAHVWNNMKDHDGVPNKETAVKNVVYTFGEFAAHKVDTRPKNDWLYDWARSALSYDPYPPISTPRAFMDPNIPFIFRQFVPYGRYQVDGEYFDNEIKGKDFRPGVQKNPKFKARLAQLIANVIFVHQNRACRYYLRTHINTVDSPNSNDPFLRITGDCECGLCCHRMTCIFPSSEQNELGDYDFEIFTESNRTLSIVPAKSTINNSAKDMVANRCGRCVVSKFVSKREGATDLATICSFVPQYRRAAFAEIARVTPDLVPDSINGFAVAAAVMHFAFFGVGHHQTQGDGDIVAMLSMLGLEFEFDIFFELHNLFNPAHAEHIGRARKTRATSNLVRSHLDQFVTAKLDREFYEKNKQELSTLARPFLSIVRDEYVQYVWPEPTFDNAIIKIELEDIKVEQPSSEQGRDYGVQPQVQEQALTSEFSTDHNIPLDQTPNFDPCQRLRRRFWFGTGRVRQSGIGALAVRERLTATIKAEPSSDPNSQQLLDSIVERSMSPQGRLVIGEQGSDPIETEHSEPMLVDPPEVLQSPSPIEVVQEMDSEPFEGGTQPFSPFPTESAPTPVNAVLTANESLVPTTPNSLAELLGVPLERIVVPAAQLQNHPPGSYISLADLKILK